MTLYGNLRHIHYITIHYENIPPTQEGGEIMSIIIAFLISVAAGVVSYYICKWLDRNNRDN